jgi:hypothetical protein
MDNAEASNLYDVLQGAALKKVGNLKAQDCRSTKLKIVGKALLVPVEIAK